MIPEYGRIVKLNGEFVELYNKLHPRTIWTQKFRGRELHITSVFRSSANFSLVSFRPKGDRDDIFSIYTLHDGRCKETKLEVFDLVEGIRQESHSNSNYCTCGGPEKEYVGFNSRTIICANCGKDKK